ncbi:MAG: TetR/AcrR family transcriptional regulator [Nocardioides sp.]|uniref:TetR/AcrR family transcriptional regulator n=1 Tax=Nocardioides sp. TaxID=35761 RepID=UPI003F0B37A2
MGTVEETSSSRERIIEAATDLFARRGYEATSTRAIGEAAGLNIATVAYHVGSKADLYLEVMRRAHAAQGEAVVAALGHLATTQPTPEATRAALHEFVDAYLGFCLSHPEVPALWMRRWLDEGEETDAIEQEFAGPLVARVADGVRAVLQAGGLADDIDLEMLVYSIIWSTHSFSRAGFVDASGTRQVASSLAMTDRFRRHLHTLVDGSLSVAP